MRTNTKKILGAVAVAGLVATGSSAFTGTGISRGAEGEEMDFVGGTVQQTVTGATLAGVKYNSTGAGTTVDSVALTFAPALSDEQLVSAIINAGVTQQALTCTSSDQLLYTCPVDNVTDGNVVVDTLDITVGDANTA